MKKICAVQLDMTVSATDMARIRDIIKKKTGMDCMFLPRCVGWIKEVSCVDGDDADDQGGDGDQDRK